MDTQKILKPASKTVVISDYRENEVNNNLERIGAIVNQRALEVADFIASDRVGIERKQHNDFISSIIDGRIFEQARNLREGFERPVIIVEGYSNREINENALKAAIAVLITDFNISLLTTKNQYDTAKTIFWIAKKEQQEMKRSVAFKVGKKPKGTKRLQEEIISSMPGVSNVISKRLLEYFGSIENIINAEENKLKEVKGVGKSLAKKIRNILTEKY